MSEQGAKGAFRTYTRHKSDIEAYERDFSAQVDHAREDYNTIVVQTLQNNLQPARDYLVNNYALTSQIGFAINGDILVGEDQSSLYYQKTDSDLLRGTDRNDLLLGESGINVMKGQAGRDVLHGGANVDILYGGTDNDVLNGGAGYNVYLSQAGDGTDRIITQAGTTDDQGHIVFTDATGRQVVAGRGTAGADGVYRGAEGIFTYNLAGSTLTISIAGAAERVIVENFQNGDLGIRLGTAAALPETMLARTSASEVLYGTGNPNALDGAGGADYLFGKGGHDHLVGGDGNDWVVGGPGDDLLEGGDGNDLLVGSTGHDILYGGAGNDFMASYADDDVVPFAPSGDLEQDQHLWASTFTNWEVVLGGITYDTANIELDGEYDSPYNILPTVTSLDRTSTAVYRKTLYGGSGNDQLAGASGHDFLSGDADNDTLFGFGGNDILEGGHGVDRLMGGVGNDALLGGDGQDILSGERGDDTLFGGLDNDILEGDSMHPQLTVHGNDTLFGDAGADNIAGQGGDDILMGGTENDVLYGDHDSLNPALHGNDVLYGDEGNDQLIGDSGDDVLYGGTDSDILYGDGPSLALVHHGNDVLDGGDGNDSLWGDGGDDTLSGGAGHDQLVGGTGMDTLEGGEGDDVLAGDAQDQVIVHAGEGVDTILRDPLDALTAIILDVDVDPESLQFAQLIGTDGSQFLALVLSPTDQVRIQHGQQDQGYANTNGGTALTQRSLMAYDATPFNIKESNRDDTIYGGRGNDTINANEGNDLLEGGAGDDLLRGHEGADILDGGSGNDALHGGAGNDTYRFGRDAGSDTIDDSDATAGNLDIISLAADVAPEAVILHHHGNELILSIDESATQLTVINHFVETSMVNGAPSATTPWWNRLPLPIAPSGTRRPLPSALLSWARPMPWSAVLEITPLWSIIRWTP